MVTTISAAPCASRELADHGHLLSLTDCMTQAKGIGGSTEVVQITSFLSFEQSAIIKLNQNHLHANKNVAVEIANSKLV